MYFFHLNWCFVTFSKMFSICRINLRHPIHKYYEHEWGALHNDDGNEYDEKGFNASFVVILNIKFALGKTRIFCIAGFSKVFFLHLIIVLFSDLLSPMAPHRHHYDCFDEILDSSFFPLSFSSILVFSLFLPVSYVFYTFRIYTTSLDPNITWFL